MNEPPRLYSVFSFSQNLTVFEKFRSLDINAVRYAGQSETIKYLVAILWSNYAHECPVDAFCHGQQVPQGVPGRTVDDQRVVLHVDCHHSTTFFLDLVQNLADQIVQWNYRPV